MKKGEGNSYKEFLECPEIDSRTGHFYFGRGDASPSPTQQNSAGKRSVHLPLFFKEVDDEKGKGKI